MRVRTFTAASMPAALKMVREAMGEDAIIINSEPNRDHTSLRVTAAVEEPEDAQHPANAASPKIIAHQTSQAADELRHELRTIFHFHNMPELFIAKLMQKATTSALNAAIAMHRIGGHGEKRHLHQLMLEKLLGDYFVFEPIAFSAAYKALMLVGPPGIGKTLTIAKIAAKLAMDKKPLAVITTDNKRAGGIEQLQAFTDILGVELKVAQTRAELLQHIQATPKKARLLIDTAGCNPYDRAQMAELEAFCNLDTIEPVLVLPAGGDSDESMDIAQSFTALPIKKLLVTRTDTARRFGGILSAAATHGLAFCQASNSPGIVDSLQPLDSAHLAALLLQHRLQFEHTGITLTPNERHAL